MCDYEVGGYEQLFIIRERDSWALASMAFSSSEAWDALDLKYVEERKLYFMTVIHIKMPDNYSKVNG
jgi:hypothetical protein